MSASVPVTLSVPVDPSSPPTIVRPNVDTGTSEPLLAVIVNVSTGLPALRFPIEAPVRRTPPPAVCACPPPNAN